MHTDFRSSKKIVMQILSMSVTKKLQLKLIPGRLKGQEVVDESCAHFVLFLKRFLQMISLTAVSRRLTLPK